MEQDGLTRDFLEFEYHAVWERYNWLKDRDSENRTHLTKLFGFLILYAAAPFTLDSFREPGLLRVWGLGGIWLALTIWFVCDRDFRAYGLHLKERMYCLHQLSILRELIMKSSRAYIESTLLPVGTLRRQGKKDSGFPEHISPHQILAAMYFLKFITLFPFLYLFIFLSSLLFPEVVVTPKGTVGLIFRVMLAFSFIPFLWVLTSSQRCWQIQRSVFSARRINRARPWPRFPLERLKERYFGGRKLLIGSLATVTVTISLMNLLRAAYLIVARARPENYWLECDLWLAGISFTWLLVLLLYVEVDVRTGIKVAQQLDPLPSQSVPG